MTGEERGGVAREESNNYFSSKGLQVGGGAWTEGAWILARWVWPVAHGDGGDGYGQWLHGGVGEVGVASGSWWGRWVWPVAESGVGELCNGGVVQ